MKTVLIVDDNDFDRNILIKVFSRKNNFNLLEASSGEQCLEIIDKNKVDLVILDVLMPSMLGTTVLTEIRKKFNSIELPVIMVTCKSDAQDIVESLMLGANDYITKPVNFDVAVVRILTHLDRSMLSHEISKLKAFESINATVATYNHEINNVLAIALGYLNGPLVKDEATVEKLKKSLWRMADTLKKITELTQKEHLEYEVYLEGKKLLKLK